MSSLSQFRREVDDFMGQHPESPLEHEQQEEFAGLKYYDEDPGYVFQPDVELLPEDEPPVTMQTSTGDARDYRRWGRVTFEVEGQPATLTVYSDEDGYDLFLPFKDATNGDWTYGAGRYLDSHRPGLRLLGGGRLELDFNYAYNPYCAYSPYYSCPLPPRENWLKVAISAGEKDYK